MKHQAGKGENPTNNIITKEKKLKENNNNKYQLKCTL